MEEQPNQPLQPTNGVGTPSRFAKIMSAARGLSGKLDAAKPR